MCVSAGKKWLAQKIVYISNIAYYNYTIVVTTEGNFISDQNSYWLGELASNFSTLSSMSLVLIDISPTYFKA